MTLALSQSRTSRSGFHVFFDPSDRFVESSPAREDSLDPHLLKMRNIPFGDDTADDDLDVIDLLLFHFLHQFCADRQVGSGHNGEADDTPHPPGWRYG